ncbi:Flavin-dependent thymidylate synthase [Candidatus Lokiarchaeum ossiferum]|uniref:FAD-dependent thymidylate synthase n=1 Tax=Candidatus Lokiarchaeum ossiferum TaxID=2951803 RepID=A0ABY6HPC4_9ARCH|nr:Flavin-dependent thymidylate synthase [Candidatus Lokiarchaeum sp. B-35]
MVIVIEPYFERLQITESDWDKEVIFQRIELAARTCYKSEDLIQLGSGERLVRGLVSRGHWAMIEFGGMFTVRFFCDRGFSHEIVRHRMCSFAQESTRYCDYTKGKFGKEITVIAPPGHLKHSQAYQDWLDGMKRAETAYIALRDQKFKPQIARANLPISIKTEICVATNLREWFHIFELRCAPTAHPSMRQLMIPLLDEFHEVIPFIFDTLWEKYCKK